MDNKPTLNLQNVPLTKAAVQQAGQDYAVNLLEAGEVSPLSAYIKLRALRDALDVALGELQGSALEEAARDPKETLHGVGWQIRNAPTRYDYSHDATWAEMKASEKATADLRKKREALLRSLEGEMVEPETGEFIFPARVISDNAIAMSLALMFPKE